MLLPGSFYSQHLLVSPQPPCAGEIPLGLFWGAAQCPHADGQLHAPLHPRTPSLVLSEGKLFLPALSMQAPSPELNPGLLQSVRYQILQKVEIEQKKMCHRDGKLVGMVHAMSWARTRKERGLHGARGSWLRGKGRREEIGLQLCISQLAGGFHATSPLCFPIVGGWGLGSAGIGSRLCPGRCSQRGVGVFLVWDHQAVQGWPCGCYPGGAVGPVKPAWCQCCVLWLKLVYNRFPANPECSNLKKVLGKQICGKKSLN